MPADALALELRLELYGASQPIVVRSMAGQERVSEPFRWTVTFVAHEVALDDARGGDAHLRVLDFDGHERHVHGVVEELSVQPTLWDDLFLYEAVLVPKASLLKYRHGFRIFQERSVPDICRSVFDEAGLREDLFEWNLRGSYTVRPNCVQYDESEWDFVNRLLEDEGIWYRFEHREDGHVMVLADESGAAPRGDPDPLAFAFSHDSFASAHAYRVEDGRRMAESAVELNDYDGVQPSRDLRARAEVEAAFGREWFEFPGGYTEASSGRRRAQVRLDELRVGADTIVVHTNALDATAGHRFEIAGAPVPIPDGFAVASEIRVEPSEEDESSRAPASQWVVENVLWLIPETTSFRPARRTRRPRIHGLQTARVTGPAGEEAHVDEQGRVKVQFHWDAYGNLDEHSSCWVPVAQGHTTGAIMNPRVGWEVIVEFYDGDPDTPVVTGRVYNPFFPPPHALPERKTLSALRSDSLPGRARINEVRFEDLAGDEHVAITAGHDLRELTMFERRVTVHRDDNREVGVSRHEVVGIVQTKKCAGNHSDSVQRDQTVNVGNDRNVIVRRTVSEQVRKDIERTVGNMSFAMIGEEVPGALQSMMRPTDKGPAQLLMESLAPILAQVRAASADWSGDGGRAQNLLAAESPPLAYVLGAVMGQLTRAPESAPDHSENLGTDAGSTLGEAIDEIDEIGEGVAQVAEGVQHIVAGVEKLEDGDIAGGVAELAAGAGDLTEGVSDVAGGLEGLGGTLDDASFLQDEGFPQDFSDVMSALGDASKEVRQLSDGAGEITGRAAAAARLAEGAAGLVDSPEARTALSVLRAIADTSREEDAKKVDEDPDDVDPFREKDHNPLRFLDDLTGESGVGETSWDVSVAVVENVGSLVALGGGIASVIGALSGGDDDGVHVDGHVLSPYEGSSVHFAASIADAFVRGGISDDGPEAEEDEDQEDEGRDHEEAAEDEEDDDPPGREDEVVRPRDEEAQDEPEDDEAPEGRGEGTWNVAVGGDAKETIAGVSIVGAGSDIRIGVGGNLTRTVGLALLEQIGGHRNERTEGAKTERVGTYVVVAGEGIQVDSDGTARCAVSGDKTLTVHGAHTLTAGGQAELRGGTLQLRASETITFECGAARVTISSDGIAIEGTQIIVRGGTIYVDSPALG